MAFASRAAALLRAVRCWEVWGPVVGALALWSAFWAPALAWISLTPLAMLAGSRRAASTVYLGAWLAGLAYFLPGVHWLRHCDPSAWLGWLLLAAYLSLYFPAAVFVARAFRNRLGVPGTVGFSIAWTAGEFVRMHLMTGFGWLLLAHTQHRFPSAIQSADLGGVYTVSFVVALANGMLADLVELLLPTSGRRALPEFFPIAWRLALGTSAIGGNFAYGVVRLRQADFRDGPHVVGVQTNVPQSLKDGDAEQSLQHLLRITAPAVQLKADLVVWPETSYPYPLEDFDPSLSDVALEEMRIARSGTAEDRRKGPTAENGAWIRERTGLVQKELRAITDQLGSPLLIGGLHYPYREGRLRQFNAAMLFAPQKGLVEVYDKQHLVPFGEYLPLEGTMPFLRRLMPYADDVEYGLDASEAPRAFHVRQWSFVSMICFEDTVPSLGRDFLLRLAPQRVDFLVNQSNDGWFQGSEEADYHLAAGLFRCVELRRPMIRVSNTGISALIDGDGRIVDVVRDKQGRTKWVAGILDVVIPLDDRESFYLRAGDWLAWACLTASGAAAAAALLRKPISL